MMNDPWMWTAPIEVIPGSQRQASSDKDGNVNRIEAPELPRQQSLLHEEPSSSYGTSVSTSSSSRRRSVRRHSRDSCSGLFSATERWQWSVVEVKPVPPYYCMERTALRVHGWQPTTISKRISDFLRIHSISATYHDDHVECITSGRCKFVVNLWQGNTASDNEVIVEAQRRSGCLLQMRRIRRNLYQHISTKDGEESPRHDNDGRLVVHSPSPTSWFNAHHAALGKPRGGRSKSEGCTTCTLERAERMLESAHVDQHELGLECLASLVDTAMSGKDSALCIAEAIACGTGKHAERLRPLFGDYFNETSLEEDKEVYDDESIGSDYSEANQYARGYQFGILHSLALQVLANCLERIIEVHESKPGKVYTLDIRSWLWRNMIHSLVYNVEVAECRPQEATLSIRCLSLILKLEPDVQHCRCVEERLIPGLVYAHKFGQAHSMKLEIESMSLMNLLY